MKSLILLCAALALTACGPSGKNHPVYKELKANPPTSIPARHLPKLRRGVVSCDVYNEGRADQYMTCWWPSYSIPPVAYLSFYGGGLLPAHPSHIMSRGGEPVTDYMPFN
ncbi:hypothetical protein SAMN05444398_10153 [Roseovarius pacificus]|uniref:Uncharacterized protein n=1 Tax=Roseovarius pacificus TaxID=337701 RepID=A0A1M6WL17_9RHOB|nr:hypothetical protein [Roseovarius pacificus]GGO53212.1 hypothetical protein GCM10011315_10580 [Roseovarius pacificus]SHK94215.1 hypothetical protein SAMN05444398_10153 [Roseovarius pacificus]